MLISREEINKKLKKELRKLNREEESKEKAIKYANDTFDYPSGLFADYYTERKPVDHANIAELYYIVRSLDFVNGDNKLENSIFTDVEKSNLKGARYHGLKAEFPLVISCIQVDADQWIGACYVKSLMALRNSQLINYNANAQRTMKMVIRHGEQQFKIAINKKAVKAIKESFESGTYIPNTITLNIPEREFDFKYDDKNNELIIYSLKAFDISDGYHRYIAMSQIYDNDNTFDYPMELRITHFSEDKARQQIWQEDQKTRMREVDSDSMNINQPCNIVVDKLNSAANCDLHGQIARVGGKVNYGELSRVIEYFYYRPNKPTSKRGQNEFILNTRDIIIPRLNAEIEQIEHLRNDNIDFIDLMIMFYCMANYEEEPVMIQHCQRGIENKDKLDKAKFAAKKPRKGLVKAVSEVV